MERTSHPLADLRFGLGCALPLLALYNVIERPWQAGIGAFWIWLVIAVSEAVVPGLRKSPVPAHNPALPWLLRIHVPIQLVLLAAGLYVVRDADWVTLGGVAFAIGFVTGAQGITYAHDLGHSRHRTDRALAWLLMTTVGYPQFMVEHYRGHHLRAATWDDPASARPGESLWRFLPRTLHGSFTEAWKLEAQRVASGRRSGWLASPLVWATLAVLLFVSTLAALGEWKMLAFWFAQAAFAVWLLEAVNYIEHYGLQRDKGEPFGVNHAWNADHWISNSLLANLQRHSDHHMHAGKAYPELEALPGPQLPTGYAGCILVAALPPVWFALMEPRLAGVPSGHRQPT